MAKLLYKKKIESRVYYWLSTSEMEAQVILNWLDNYNIEYDIHLDPGEDVSHTEFYRNVVRTMSLHKKQGDIRLSFGIKINNPAHEMLFKLTWINHDSI
jgi:hypothetical protein